MSENNHILDDRRPGLYIFSARQQGYQKIKRKRASLFALEKGEEHPGKGNNLGKGLRVIVTVAGYSDSGGDRTRSLTLRRRTLYPLSYTVVSRKDSIAGK